MKIFCDSHHQDLFHSLQILFEKRLGHEVYKPIGIEWYTEGYWKVYPQIETAKQFLCNFCNIPAEGGVVEDIAWPYHVDQINHRGITFNAFKDMKFDIIVSSMPAHHRLYGYLRDIYQPQAKHILQAGNNWGDVKAKNLLTSAKKCHSSRPGANVVFYHQEFSLDHFRPIPCENIKSIMNLEHYSSSLGDLEQVERFLSNDWNVYYYGAGNRDGPCTPHETIPKIGFVWHVKRGGDGYGYNIHQAFACGKPMVVGYRYHQGSTPEDLFESDKTIIDFHSLGAADIAATLERAADDYQVWSDAVYKRFKEVVDFDEEEVRIRSFLDCLQ